MSQAKRGRGRPQHAIPTPTAVHKRLLDHFNGDLSEMGKTLGVARPQIRRWFLQNNFPMERVVQLSRKTPFTLDELIVLSSVARVA